MPKSFPCNHIIYLSSDIQFDQSRIDSNQLRFEISLGHPRELDLTTPSRICFGARGSVPLRISSSTFPIPRPHSGRR